jgi:uncharacterized membrane protein YeaQ/YmgE (transglycosylase-associated protein family)
MIGLIIGLIISGLIIGALGRLAVPGPNPMSIGMTILVGIGGSLVGGLVARALAGEDAGGLALILGILCAAAIIYFMQRRNAGTRV